MTRRGLIGVLGAGLIASVTGCGSRSARYRVRVSIIAEEAGRRAVGSSVLEVNARTIRRLFAEEPGGSAGLRGEAVAVSLPNRTIFGLLVTADPTETLDGVITVALSGQRRFMSPADYVAAVRRIEARGSDASVVTLPEGSWPRMVTFDDPADSRTVRPLPPSVTIRGVALELTRDPVTDTIHRRLPWLVSPGSTLDPHGPPTTTPNLAQTLRQRDFLNAPANIQ